MRSHQWWEEWSWTWSCSLFRESAYRPLALPVAPSFLAPTAPDVLWKRGTMLPTIPLSVLALTDAMLPLLVSCRIWSEVLIFIFFLLPFIIQKSWIILALGYLEARKAVARFVTYWIHCNIVLLFVSLFVNNVVKAQNGKVLNVYGNWIISFQLKIKSHLYDKHLNVPSTSKFFCHLCPCQCN